jgi:hypothetical protein
VSRKRRCGSRGGTSGNARGGGESVLEVGVAADVLREQHGDVKLDEIVATVALSSFRCCSWVEAGVGEERLR